LDLVEPLLVDRDTVFLLHMLGWKVIERPHPLFGSHNRRH
jgi:hypothetical protein